jgi:acyl carrier protein
MTLERVKKILAEHLDISESEISADTTFEELGIDSLDTVEILMELEDEFGIEIAPDDSKNSVGALCRYIDSKKE